MGKKGELQILCRIGQSRSNKRKVPLGEPRGKEMEPGKRKPTWGQENSGLKEKIQTLGKDFPLRRFFDKGVYCIKRGDAWL